MMHMAPQAESPSSDEMKTLLRLLKAYELRIADRIVQRSRKGWVTRLVALTTVDVVRAACLSLVEVPDWKE